MPGTEEPESEPLYHYTSQTGLRGILESGELWAGDIRYLNDSKEFIHALELAKKSLRRRLEAAEEDDERALLTKLLDRTGREQELTSRSDFAASLTAKGDLLSQWLSYCPGGSGFSIGFDRVRLEENAAREGFRLVPCEYSRSAQEASIEKIIDTALAGFRKQLAGSTKLKQEGSGALVKLIAWIGDKTAASVSGFSFWSTLAEIAPIFKHPSFEAEEEWRLIPESSLDFAKRMLRHMTEQKDYSYQSKPLEPEFREGRHSLVPYVPISLRDAGDERLPIVEIVVGPTRYPRLAENALKGYLKKLGYEKEVPVRLTEATYRQF